LKFNVRNKYSWAIYRTFMSEIIKKIIDYYAVFQINNYQYRLISGIEPREIKE